MVTVEVEGTLPCGRYQWIFFEGRRMITYPPGDVLGRADCRYITLVPTDRFYGDFEPDVWGVGILSGFVTKLRADETGRGKRSQSGEEKVHDVTCGVISPGCLRRICRSEVVRYKVFRMSDSVENECDG